MAQKSIIIGGQRFELSGNVTVITYEDLYSSSTPFFPSFPRARAQAMATLGSNLYGDRTIKGKRITRHEDMIGAVSQIILHTDLTRDAEMCFRVLVGRGLSTHFMIDWDGVIFQGADVLYTTYHAGEFNAGSVGIDLNNMMPNLVREPNGRPYREDHPRFGEMSQKEFRRPRSGRMRINGGQVQSYGYTDAQYTALIELLKVLCDELEIPKEVPFDVKGEIVTDVLDDTGFQGIIAHWHVSADRWDPGPGFDWQRVYYALQGEHNSFPIELSEGVNIATLLEPDRVREYADTYFHNNETMGRGGWYPMGLNQTWHGGIHLTAARGTPVRAMFDGVVVAARFGSSPTRLGHNNFVLLRHDVPIPPRTRGGEPKRFEFFSLYMHLEPIDFGVTGDDLPRWVAEMLKADAGKADARDEAFEKQQADDGFEVGEFGEIIDDGLDDLDDLGISEAVDQRTRWLPLGIGLAALRRGGVSLIEFRESPIRVRSGDILGGMGVFGSTQDDWAPTVHVEVFADPAKDWKEAVNLGIHGRHLVELDDDVGADLFVENTDILNLFGGGQRRTMSTSLVPQKVLSPADIQEFFTLETEYVEEKRFLRRVVVRHVSEWSDQVDWVAALSKAEDWNGKIADFRRLLRGSTLGREAIETILPWIWLSKDVAQHIGLNVGEWRGFLDHFHPIQFLLWLTYHSTQRVQSISRGVSAARLKVLREEEERRAQEARFEMRSGFGASFFVEESEEQTAGEVLKRWLTEWDMGEWERPIPDEF